MRLEEPWWLLLVLVIPLFVVGSLLTARLRRKQWGAFAAARLRPMLLRRGSQVPRWLSFSMLLAAVAVLAVVLARPQAQSATVTDTTKGRNVLFALDLSRSMLATDLKPDRLTQAKTLCYDMMDALPADRVGVIGFAGEPYLVAPLTSDHASVRETVDQLDINYIPVGGSDLESALEMSIKTLKETGQKENALILLTDGDETTGRLTRLGEDAKKSGIYVFTIGMGTELGDFVPDSDFPDGRHRDRAGNPVRSRLNSEPLKQIAIATGGRFAAATSAASIPEMVKLAIADMEKFEIAGRERVLPVEYFQWFLLPAILLLMAAIIAGTRWRGLGPASTSTAAVVALLFALSSQPARASVEEDARRALAEGRHEDAAIYYEGLAATEKNAERQARFRLAQGSAAARAGDTDTARTAFSEALRSENPDVRAAAHHGLGNLLFGSGWLHLSNNAAYPGANPPEDQPKPNLFQRLADSILGLDKDEEKKPEGPMETFDAMVKQALSEWMQSDSADQTPSAGYQRFENTLTDWIDGVKHYDAALRYQPSLDEARHNRALTVKYLTRLREILKEVQESAQQLQSGPGEGPGPGDQPQPEGQGDGDQEGDGSGREGEEEGQGGEPGDNENQGPGGDRPQDKKDGDGKDGKEGQKPRAGESEDDAARRILRENADFEKGALRPGRLEYRQPEKDW